MLANDYLEGILDGTIKAKCSEKNERANPWQTAEVCEQIEAIRPNNPICDSTIAQWNYIAGRAYYRCAEIPRAAALSALYPALPRQAAISDILLPDNRKNQTASSQLHLQLFPVQKTESDLFRIFYCWNLNIAVFFDTSTARDLKVMGL